MSMHVRGMPVRYVDPNAVRLVDLLVQLWKPVRQYFNHRVSFDDADDLMQEMAERVTRAGTGNIDEPLNYLYRIARNLLAEHLAAQARTSHVVCDSDVFEELRDTVFVEKDIEEIIERETEARALLGAIQSDRQRNALILHGAFGYSMEETAAKLGLSVASVDKYYARAKRACREAA